jgi:hypothetical protein
LHIVNSIQGWIARPDSIRPSAVFPPPNPATHAPGASCGGGLDLLPRLVEKLRGVVSNTARRVNLAV